MTLPRLHAAPGLRSGARKPAWPVRMSLVGAALGFAAPLCHAVAAPVGDAGSSGGTTLAYSFDSKLLLGTPLGVADIERFNKANAIEPGSYRVDVYVNDVFVTREAVEFRSAGGDVHPCLSDQFLATAGIDIKGAAAGAAAPATSGDSTPGSPVPSGDAPATGASTDTSDAGTSGGEAALQCGPLAHRVPGASTAFDLPRLRLNITVPQAQMKHVARGAIDASSFDAGETAAWVNYDVNYFTASASGYKSDSLYTGINAGLNVGLWRLRQQSTYNWGSSAGITRSNWNNIRTYAERPLVSLGSKLIVGQNYTGGTLFSSVGYTGFHLETDDRMLPDSMRGYAPVVNGVANTNARVVVSQNGNVIYQTTVAPGPFSITDLNPTSFQGDLSVQVFEANGQVSTFTVPFSAVPNSLRPGLSHWSTTVGQVRQIEGSSAKFGDLTYERGLTNAITVNGGVRVSPDYQSMMSGAVLATRVGAIGANVAWSHALDVGGHHVNGWLGSINYSNTIQRTGTTFTLAGYRYSTGGYRDFVDALSARAAAARGVDWSSTTYKQRDQFLVNVNQNFGSYGSLSGSASTSSYYGRHARDTQFQISYNNHFKSISYNLSLIRQQTGTLYGASTPGLIGGTMGQTNTIGSRSTTAFMATVSIPINFGSRSASVSGSFSHSSDQGAMYQASVSGIADEAQSLSYGLTASGETQSASRSFAGNIQKNLSMITVGANYSNGNGYWQAGATARGAAVVHSGGVTLGPYLSDTFGIVEAKGAEGATVRNTQGTKVDGWGYAIVPSLTPYRYNEVALDTKGINPNAELTGGQVRVAPYAGSAVRLKFETRIGHALLIGATRPDGEPLPLGADVLDSSGAAIGVVGQGSQVYARVASEEGALMVKWGSKASEQCSIAYHVKEQDRTAPISRFDAQCLPAPAAPANVAGTVVR
ncbi:fimbria/pilus outer membrane usher protein [Paraburkholderia dinghuensis]|nr:fimbria/pilus outer membrane usher protein [Paraburkholderia dinghuensis]